MSKRKHSGFGKGVWQGAAAAFAAMLILSGLLALLIRQGAIGSWGWKPGMILICLAAGASAVLFGPKGEGRGAMLLTSGIPAAVLLLAGAAIAGVKGMIPGGALHGLCLMLPGLMSLLIGGGRRRRAAGFKKHRRIAGVR